MRRLCREFISERKIKKWDNKNFGKYTEHYYIEFITSDDKIWERREQDYDSIGRE